MNLFAILLWEVEYYGLDVVAAFGEYCGHQRRLRRRLPAVSLETLSTIVKDIMRGAEGLPSGEDPEVSS